MHLRASIVLTLLLAGCATPTAPVTKRETRKMAAQLPSGNVVRYLDTLDAGLSCARAFASIERHYEKTFAPPYPPVYEGVPWAKNGTPAPASLGTQQFTASRPHCFQPSRHAKPMRQVEADSYAVLKAYCLANDDAGPGPCRDVADNCPPLVTSLDPSWDVDDGGTCYFCDGGACSIPIPPDPYDGAAP